MTESYQQFLALRHAQCPAAFSMFGATPQSEWTRFCVALSAVAGQIPQNQMGYVADLLHPWCARSVFIDRLDRLGDGIRSRVMSQYLAAYLTADKI